MVMFRVSVLCRQRIFVKTSWPIKRVASFSTVSFDGNIGIHLAGLKKRYLELEKELGSVDVNVNDLPKLGKEFASLAQLVELTDQRQSYKDSIKDLNAVEQEEGLKGTADSKEMVELVVAERIDVQAQLDELEAKIVKLLTPKDEADSRGVVLEVKAGTGGDEASLFASEMFKMYQKYALLKGWKWEEVSLARTEIGGFKDAQALINGDDVFKYLKFESGVHRVQRIPCNDTKIQTSAASVIVMPEADELEVTIRPQDLRIDVYRAGGAGGQSVNKTESAVRMVHIPTGLVVCMQDERSQIQNRARALKYLKAKLLDLEQRKSNAARSEMRTAAQGTGDRSDKIRTYNFPQDRISDHRIGLTVAGVERVMNGERLDEILEGLYAADERDRLENFLESIKNKRNTY